MGLLADIPALLTSRSGAPSRPVTSASAASISVWSVTSRRTARMVRPSAAACPIRSSALARSRTPATTAWPRRASSSARALPIPELAPVTRATGGILDWVKPAGPFDNIVQPQTAAVGVERLAGHVGGVIAGQKGGHGRDLVRVASAAQRRAGEEPIRGLGCSGHGLPRHLGQDRTRTNRVDPNTVRREGLGADVGQLPHGPPGPAARSEEHKAEL